MPLLLYEKMSTIEEVEQPTHTRTKPKRKMTPSLPYGNLILECLTIQTVFFLLFIFDRSLGFLRVPLLALILLLLASRERKVEGPEPLQLRVILLLGLALRIWVILGVGPHYSDIIERTADAINYLRLGENPYSAEMDLPAGKYKGYKYNPFTFLFYLLPFTILDFPGILIVNLVLEAATILLTYMVGSQLGSKRIGSWASLFYAISPIAIYEGVYRVTADVLPSTLTLFSLYLASRQKTTEAGVTLGLSLASKPFPGGPMLLLLLKQKEGRYRILIYSAVVSLILVIPFLLWSPSSFIGNTILFSAESRPLPRESIRYFLPESLEPLLKPIQTLSVLLILILWMYNRETLENIPFWHLSMTSLIIIFNHWIHRNYILWILPYLCISWAERLLRTPQS